MSSPLRCPGRRRVGAVGGCGSRRLAVSGVPDVVRSWRRRSPPASTEPRSSASVWSPWSLAASRRRQPCRPALRASERVGGRRALAAVPRQGGCRARRPARRDSATRSRSCSASRRRCSTARAGYGCLDREPSGWPQLRAEASRRGVSGRRRRGSRPPSAGKSSRAARARPAEVRVDALQLGRLARQHVHPHVVADRHLVEDAAEVGLHQREALRQPLALGEQLASAAGSGVAVGSVLSRLRSSAGDPSPRAADGHLVRQALRCCTSPCRSLAQLLDQVRVLLRLLLGGRRARRPGVRCRTRPGERLARRVGRAGRGA